jgi:hypothetical protein
MKKKIRAEKMKMNKASENKKTKITNKIYINLSHIEKIFRKITLNNLKKINTRMAKILTFIKIITLLLKNSMSIEHSIHKAEEKTGTFK